MPEVWLNKPELKYSQRVYDIVWFGSSLYSREFNDVDVAVIYKSLPIKEQLIEGQKIKKQLEKFTNHKIDLINFDFYSLFDDSNFSREGIIFYGKSLIDNKFFSEKLGFRPLTLISYSLNKLNKSGKVRFHYLLKGKGGKYGLLRKYGGELIKPGLIRVNPLFEEFFLKEMSKEVKELRVEHLLVSKSSNF